MKSAGPGSDVTRVRDMLVAALVAALTLAAGLALARPSVAPGPLGRPHEQAAIGCASCHVAGAGSAASACVSCHAPLVHRSTRRAHQALMASGVLRCVDCHPAHSGGEGVTFEENDRFVRWGAGEESLGRGVSGPPGATVPFVAVSACSRCHDLTAARDPARACVTAGGFSRCFDEHVRAGEPSAPVRAACARQHTSARFVAWDAASRVLDRAEHFAPRPAVSLLLPLGFAISSASTALVFLGWARRRRRRAVKSPLPLVAPPRRALPVINASTCLGCYACVDACPFAVLEVERYVAKVARPAECCGVMLCEQVCPNGSLQVSEQEAVPDRIRVDATLESLDVPGLFLAGDLTGMPLIKNAIRHGVRAIDRIVETMAGAARSEAKLDVVVIGAGPAGLSASLRAEERGISYVTLEQGTLGGSIRSFPRNKLVFDQPLELPLEGDLTLRECTKEELLSEWERIARMRRLAIREGARVVDVGRSADGSFVVKAETPEGPTTFVSRRVLLAIGKRGTPRPLVAAISDDARENVHYALADARTFASRRVLIVGLGDTAMEAAIAIARQPGAIVTMCHRGTAFTRGKARNVNEAKAMIQRGQLRVLFESRVVKIERGRATVDVKGREEVLANDAVLALIGGTPSSDLLQRVGVRFGR